MANENTFDSSRYVSEMKEISDKLYGTKTGSQLRELIENLDKIDCQKMHWEDVERARRIQRDMEDARRCYKHMQELLEAYF